VVYSLSALVVYFYSALDSANPLGFLSEIVAKIPLCSDELLEKSLKNFEKKGSRRELIFHGLL
jgi:hypothetical protein